jgi:DNA-binding transcriptional MerR regulator
MLLVGDLLYIHYLKGDKKVGLKEFINKKVLRVADTPLSYRQINSLDSDKLLSPDRKSNGSWRKFSFKDMVYILLVDELKKFGLKHEQLRHLWASFFAEGTEADINNYDKKTADIAIGLALGKVEIMITVDSTGEVNFFDAIYYLALTEIAKPRVTIQLNTIVNRVLKIGGKSEIPISCTIPDYITKTTSKMSDKEKRLLKIVRDKNIKAVGVRKKKGEIELVYAEKVKNCDKKMTDKEMLEVIKSSDFQDINMKRREGKIQSYKVEETIKL